MVGYDFDGVISNFSFLPPALKDAVVITGSSYEEHERIEACLAERRFNLPVYYNGSVTAQTKNNIFSALWKAKKIKELGITRFYEDDLTQYNILMQECPGVTICLVSTTEAELLEDAIRTSHNFYAGMEDPQLLIDKDFAYFTYNHPDATTFAPKNTYDIIVLFSGGIDSFVAYKYALTKFNRVKPVFIDYGQPYAQLEKAVVLSFGLSNLEPTIDLSQLVKMDSAVDYGEIFPGRNWVLCVAASKYIQNRGEIWMSAIGGEVKALWGDKSEYFFTRGSELLSTALNKHVLLSSPFKNLTKGQIIGWYLSQGFPVSDLLRTVSCHNITNVGEIPCGQCMGCAHRYVGMMYNGIEEAYASDIKAYARSIYEKELNSLSEFSEQRKIEIMQAIF